MKNISGISELITQDFNITEKLFWISDLETTKFGRSLRDALIKDTTGEIVLTIWSSSLMDSVEEKKCYNFINVSTRVFNGIKLTTGRNTIIELTQNNDNIEVDV